MYKNQIRYELRIKLAIKCDNKKKYGVLWDSNTQNYQLANQGPEL